MSKTFLPVFIILVIASIVLLQSGFLFLLLAMLPTLAAFYIDHDPNKPIFKVVGASNIAATLPYLTPMIHTSFKFHHYDISPILRDPNVWLFVYCGAAAGWGLIYICRLIASFVVTISFEYNIVSLEAFQKRLVAEWGPEIQPGSGE